MPALLALIACHGAPATDPVDQPASPQAKAEPAPIASPPTASPGTTPPIASASAGAPVVVPPQPMRPDEAPAPDAPPKEPTHEGSKEVPPAMYTLTLALRSSDVAPPPKGVELSAAGVEAARRDGEPSLVVDLTPGHVRVVLQDGFVLANGTELRVRSDLYGYVVVSPDGASYRVGATGSLRAILGEGLFDVAPSSLAEVVARGEGARRLGRVTRRIEVTTRAAKGSFDLARIPELGDSGRLVCRMLLDLMSAGPATPVCGDGDLPLHVELKWSAQPARAAGARIAGVSTFDAVDLVRRTDLLPPSFLTPPPSAAFMRAGDEVTGSHVFLTHADLAALRVGGAEPPGHPGEGPAVLSLHNSTDELRYVWLDGVPLAWLAPGGRLDVSGVPHARATVQWRTFLGDAIDPGQTVSLPTMVDALATPSVSAADHPLP
jgi:hypothetical protein